MLSFNDFNKYFVKNKMQFYNRVIVSNRLYQLTSFIFIILNQWLKFLKVIINIFVFKLMKSMYFDIKILRIKH